MMNVVERAIEPLHYEEALGRIHEVRQRLKIACARIELKEKNLVPVRAFEFLLAAEVAALKFLNDGRFNYAIPWDLEVNIPSVPSMIADVGVYAARALCENKAYEVTRYACLSFSKEIPILRERYQCACGRVKFAEREIGLEILMRHIIKKRGTKLLLSQIIGIMSDDKTHLDEHYHGDVLTPELVQGLGVWRCDAVIAFDRGAITVSADHVPQCKKEFRGEKFAEFFSREIEKFNTYSRF